MTDKRTLDDLSYALVEVEAEIAIGLHKRKRKILGRDSWGGADVIVTDIKDRKGWDGDLVLITPHAAAVGWYFYRIKEVAYGVGGIDHLSKLGFFHDLAKAVADLPEGADENQVFKALLTQTRVILEPNML